MTMLTRRDSRTPLDLFEWLEAPWTVLRPVGGHPVRVEDYVQDGRYVIRAELPGLDPEKDLEIMVSKGIVTIKAERREDSRSRHHSEFRYGSFSRSVTLPAGTDEATVDAVYDNGILQISAALSEKADDKVSRTIPVRLNQHIKPT
jgi:HSP20 family protein